MAQTREDVIRLIKTAKDEISEEIKAAIQNNNVRVKEFSDELIKEHDIALKSDIDKNTVEQGVIARREIDLSTKEANDKLTAQVQAEFTSWMKKVEDAQTEQRKSIELLANGASDRMAQIQSLLDEQHSTFKGHRDQVSAFYDDINAKHAETSDGVLAATARLLD